MLVSTPARCKRRTQPLAGHPQPVVSFGTRRRTAPWRSCQVSDSRNRQDSLIMRESHFKNLQPSATAQRLHETLATELGPIIATAALRRASDHCHVAIPDIGPEHLSQLVPNISKALKTYSAASLLKTRLQALLDELAPSDPT